MFIKPQSQFCKWLINITSESGFSRPLWPFSSGPDERPPFPTHDHADKHASRGPAYGLRLYLLSAIGMKDVPWSLWALWEWRSVSGGTDMDWSELILTLAHFPIQPFIIVNTELKKKKNRIYRIYDSKTNLNNTVCTLLDLMFHICELTKCLHLNTHINLI